MLGWLWEQPMDQVKQFFDVLDYATVRAILFGLIVIGGYSLIKRGHR